MSDNTTATPPKTFSRNEHGLIADGSVTYVYNEDGSINWRKMIPDEYLVPNSKLFIDKGLPIPSSTDGLTDRQVLILLGGLKELAQIRGFTSVNHTITTPNENYVAAVCAITWEPNYETRGKEVTFSAVGDACPNNTNKLGRDYLGPIAENRAFCRAVRNFLKIHIVSQDEVSDVAATIAEDTATTILRQTIEKYKVPFTAIKERLVKEGVEGADKFNSIEDIPRANQFALIERIKRKAAEREVNNPTTSQ